MSSTDKVFSSNKHRIRTALSVYEDQETGLVQRFALIEGDAGTFRFLVSFSPRWPPQMSNAAGQFTPQERALLTSSKDQTWD